MKLLIHYSGVYKVAFFGGGLDRIKLGKKVKKGIGRKEERREGEGN